MATISKSTNSSNTRLNVVTTSWTLAGFTTTDTCEALPLTGADRSVQFVGTVTATIVIEGSNDGGTTYATLTDPLGTALSFSAVGLSQISQFTGLIRPRITSGTAGSGCKCYISERGV